MRTELYEHFKQEHSIDLHRSDAMRLGFPDFAHVETIVGPNQSMITRQKPLELNFYPSVRGGTLSSAHYRECKVCGKDHEDLVIAFLEDYRQRKDGGIVNVREEKRKKWETQGMGESLASDILDSGLSDTEIRHRLNLQEGSSEAVSKVRTAPTPPPPAARKPVRTRPVPAAKPPTVSDGDQYPTGIQMPAMG